jgi:Asp-tRNA(Asn)/Glu-tRNA(Gln) amidotransferase A subunit family amidase
VQKTSSGPMNIPDESPTIRSAEQEAESAVTELHEFSALEQAAAIRARDVSPLELADHYLERIDRLDMRFNAYLTVVPELTDESLLMPFTRSLRSAAASVSGADCLQALQRFQAAGQQLADTLFAGYDVVLSPTLAAPPGLIGALRSEDPGAEFAAMAAFMPYTPLANITGLPSISLPLHWNAQGLPIGSMLTARYGAEALLLSLAAQLEVAKPWSGRQPVLR